MKRSFWHRKKVFVTGHTGFKGSWLSLWLADMGAFVFGYALPPLTAPNLFDIAVRTIDVETSIGDIRDRKSLLAAMQKAQPEILIHLAAQPLVLESYRNPVATYETNVMGTVNVFEAARQCESLKAIINVTTDKCYANREWEWGYREIDELGGDDPYSSSKACSELITNAYRRSFFSAANVRSNVAIATARSGNVFGGGDWAADRLVPDCLRSLMAGKPIMVRNPDSIRPWQHVMESLGGYLMLAEYLVESGQKYAESWNFGPSPELYTVEQLVRKLCREWSGGASFELVRSDERIIHETHSLLLDSAKTRQRIGWKPIWPLNQALRLTVEWAKSFQAGADMRQVTLAQIREYERQAVLKGE